MTPFDGEAPREGPDPEPAPASAAEALVPLPPHAAMDDDLVLLVPRDRWAHRRGEPRVFAFLWTVYLFAATAITLAQVGTTGVITVELYRPGARQLLIWVAVGVAVLWPMIRLSQSPPPRPVSAAIKDIIVLLVPAQAVIWPQWWLAAWPLAPVLAVAATLAAWASLLGAFLAAAGSVGAADGFGRDRRAPRAGTWAWMLAVLLVTVGAPLGVVLAGGLPPGGQAPPLVDARWMISPMTAVYEITRDRSYAGESALAAPAHWWAIAATGALSIPLWGVALVRASGVRRFERLH